VVSTIPLNLFTAMMDPFPESLHARIRELEFCSERFLFVHFNKPKISGNHWTYFSDNATPFNRVAEFTCDKFEMVPHGTSLLTFEFPCNEGDLLWALPDEELLQMALKGLAGAFSVNRDDVIAYCSARQKFAYPRFITNYRGTLHSIFGFINSLNNTYSIGRQGMFCYLNVDGATRMGLQAAEWMLAGKPSHQFHSLKLRKYHKVRMDNPPDDKVGRP